MTNLSASAPPVLVAAAMMIALATVPPTVVAQYDANWASIDARPVPSWYTDARFGIFVHWGVYSVPAFAPVDVSLYARYAEWYWRRLTDPESEGYAAFRSFHDRVFGSETTYPDLARQFGAEQFDPQEWARIFADAGAKYVVLTSKHHDGYTLWPSRYSWNWNAADVGPHRDLAGELAGAVTDAGLRMGFYYSLYEWFNPQYHEDLQGYIDGHMWPQLKELVTTYEPDIVWADGEWEHPSETWGSASFLSWLYNESPVRETVVVNDRWGAETRSRHGGFYTTEYMIVHDGEGIDPDHAMHPWEECRGIGGSFGYNRNENLEHYASSEELIELLVDVVSRGGNLLLNVGPTADGRIPVIMQQRLADMGTWLKVNGEAIYETERWNEAPAVENVRFTRRGDDLFAIALAWPESELRLPMEVGEGATISLLGRDEPLSWRREGGETVVAIPPLSVDEVPSAFAHVFRVHLP